MQTFLAAEKRGLWDAGEPIGPLNTTTDGVSRAWARAQIFGQLVKKTDLDVLKHITTDHTARDMLRIVEAHGRQKLQYWEFP